MRNDRWKPFDIGKIPEINTKIKEVYVPQGNITQENVLYDVECMSCGYKWTSNHKKIQQKITLFRDTCKVCRFDKRRFKYLGAGPVKGAGLSVVRFSNKLKIVRETTYEVEYDCCGRRAIMKHRAIMILSEKTGPVMCHLCIQRKKQLLALKGHKHIGVQWDPPPSALDPNYPRWK